MTNDEIIEEINQYCNTNDIDDIVSTANCILERNESEIRVTTIRQTVNLRKQYYEINDYLAHYAPIET